jgi:hypothetical protein
MSHIMIIIIIINIHYWEKRYITYYNHTITVTLYTPETWFVSRIIIVNTLYKVKDY